MANRKHMYILRAADGSVPESTTSPGTAWEWYMTATTAGAVVERDAGQRWDSKRWRHPEKPEPAYPEQWVEAALPCRPPPTPTPPRGSR